MNGAEWFAQRVRRSAARSLAVTAGLVSVGGLGAVAFAVPEEQRLVGSVVAAAGGVAVAALRALVTVLFGPTGMAYQRSYGRTATTVTAAGGPSIAPSDAAAASVADLQALGFDVVDSLVDGTLGTVVTETTIGDSVIGQALAARDGRVTGFVSQASGAVTAYSRLTDGRILVTAAGVIPPSPRLVVNAVDDDASPAGVVRRHAQVLRLMFETRLAPDDAATLVADALSAEREAWRALGSMTAALVHVAGRRGVVRLATGVGEEQLLLRSALWNDPPAVPILPAGAVAAPVSTVVDLWDRAVDAPLPERPRKQPLPMWDDSPKVHLGGRLRELDPQGV